MGTELVTKSFENQCLAFHDRVEKALSTVVDVGEATDMLAKATAMQTYAKKLEDSVKVERPIAISVLKIKAKVGELSPREQGKRTDKLPVSGAGSFNSHTLSAYRKIGDSADRLDEYYQACEDVPSQEGFLQFVASGGIQTKFTGEVEWYTPKEWIEMARDVMGSIDVDPASSPYAQKIVKAGTFYTESDNGLECEWFGNVWLNPPYKHPAVSDFANAFCDEYEQGNVKQAIMLVNNVTDNKWFHRCASIGMTALTLGRISFYNAHNEKSSPTNGQAFFYLGPKRGKFRTVFSKSCIVMELSK